MSEGEVKLTHAQSTSLYSVRSPHAQDVAITELLQRLPPRAECDPAIISFFSQHNWRFGVPEITFRRNYESMWQITAAHENVHVNPHWLGLLFSCLAFSTTNSAAAADNFYHAISARRVAEDLLLAPAFTSSNGSKVTASADGNLISSTFDRHSEAQP